MQSNKSEPDTSVPDVQQLIIMNIFPIIWSNSDLEKIIFCMSSTENEGKLQFRPEEP